MRYHNTSVYLPRPIERSFERNSIRKFDFFMVTLSDNFLLLDIIGLTHPPLRWKITHGCGRRNAARN